MKFDLKHELEKRNLSKADLSRMTGISRSTIGFIEEGTTRDPHPNTIKIIFDALKKYDSEKDQNGNSADVMSEEESKYPHLTHAVVQHHMDFMRINYLAASPEKREQILEAIKITYPGSLGEYFITFLKSSE